MGSIRLIAIVFLMIILTFAPSFAEKHHQTNNPFDISHLITQEIITYTCPLSESTIEQCIQTYETEDFNNKKTVEIASDLKLQNDTQKIPQVVSLQNDSTLTMPLGLSYNSGEAAMSAINKSLNLFSNKIKERFSIWLERSARYVEIMKDILKEKNMPTELVFLPLIESGFNLNAYSRAHAVGPWQFIESTGKRYGLIIDWWRDERKDPIKSTKAAANYLKDLYRMFGSWELALAAYNAGEGRISKALKRTYSDDYWDLLRTDQIKEETKNYVPHFIAATMIAKKPEAFGFHFLDYHEPLEYDEITLHEPLDLEVIAQCANTTINEIKQLNAELRRWSTPPNAPKYTIKLPADTKETFLLNLSKVPSQNRFSFDTYTVKKGENIRTIAKKLNIPAIAIIELNGFSGLESFKSGDTIKIPPKDKFVFDIHDKMSAKKVSAKKVISSTNKEKKSNNKQKKSNNKQKNSSIKIKSKSKIKQV